MINNNPAPTDHPITDLVANRWSPLSYADKPVEEEKINSLLEAARWAPSSFNEQPWSYVVGRKGDEIHEKLASTLMEGNAWAKNAGVLMLSVGKSFFEHKHKANRHFMHDLGAATALMTMQATDMDLVTHQMAGFDADKARELFNIEEDFEPCAMIAIGYQGELDALDEGQQERQKGARQRKPHTEMLWKK